MKCMTQNENDLTQNESQSEIKCEFEFSCIVSDPHKTRTSFKNAQKCADEAEQVEDDLTKCEMILPKSEDD